MALTKVHNRMVSNAPANIRDFGAVGNGTTNDATAIQAALDSGASVVYIPAGTYRCDSTLTVPVNVSLIGDGSGVSIIDGTQTTAASLTGNTHIKIGSDTMTQIQDLSADVDKFDRSVTLDGTPTISQNDVFLIYNPTDYSWSGFRTSYRAGEFCRAASISGNTINLQSSLAADYASADVSLYKLSTPTTCKVQGFTLKGLSDTSNQIYGMYLYGAIDSSVEDVKIIGPSYHCLSVSSSFNVQVRNVTLMEDAVSSFGGDYGLAIGNSQNVNVIGGYFSAARHGVTIGGSDKTGAVPNRYLTFSDCFVSTTAAGGTHASDIHGNAEHILYHDCILDGGSTIGGDYVAFDNCQVRSPVSGLLLYGGEPKGTNIRIQNCTLDGNGDVTNRGVFIDIGGNSAAISSSTKNGGTIQISGNTMQWRGASTLTYGAPIMIYNRGYTGTQQINVFITDNSFQYSISGDRCEVSIDTSGSTPYGTIDFSGNSCFAAGNIHIDNTTSNQYSAENVYIHDNKIVDADNSPIIANVEKLVSIKGNTVSEGNAFSFYVTADSGYETNDVHITGNTTVNNFINRTSSSATNADVYVNRADNVVYHDNFTGSGGNEYITVASNTGFVVGETITGGTSGATATVAGTRSTTEIMITTTRSGTFSGSETITGGTSGSSTTYGGTTATTKVYAASFNNITNLWRGRNVDKDGDSDNTSSIGTDTAI